MSCCEKCWADAGLRQLSNPHKSKTEHYYDLLNERESMPCSELEQTRNYWDRIFKILEGKDDNP